MRLLHAYTTRGNICASFSDGEQVVEYVLEASRADDSWGLDFTLLPRSPDYQVVVRVYDNGHISNGL